MKNRHMRVLGMLILVISTVTPLIAQERPQVDAPADSFGRRFLVQANGAGSAPSGDFSTATLQVGAKPEPFTYATAVTLECTGGPFPSGFDIEMIDIIRDVIEFRIRFRASSNCIVPAKPGATYQGVGSPSAPGQGLLEIRSQTYTQCQSSGTGSVTVNRYDVYSTKVIGSSLTVGFLDADFTFACAQGDVTGKIQWSTDNIPEGAELLNPDDAGGGDGGGGTDPEPLPPPPPPDAVVGFPTTVLQEGLLMTNDSTETVPLSTITQNGFSGDVDIEVFSDATEAEGLSVSLSQTHFPAPGTGNSTLTIKVGPNTFPRDYYVTVVTTANGKQAFNTIKVTVLCDPPMILGIDQPRGASFSGGGSATLETKAVGSGPLTYQWFSGPRGSTNFPVNGGNAARLTTNNEGLYWVRVSNACGSVDSAPALISRQ